MTTEGLLRVARMKKTKDEAKSKERRSPVRRRSEPETARPWIAPCDFRKQKIDNR